MPEEPPSPPTATKAPLAFEPGIVALLEPDLSSVSLAVHPEDEMLAFIRDTLHQGLYRSLSLYFRSGSEIWREVRGLLEARPGGLEGVGRILDFACGHGRVTRHVAAELGAERVWVAEVQPDAVAFLTQTLGVRGLVTSHDPNEFRCDRRFDAILASSLFTHLPLAAFEGWLERLLDQLTADGWLLFSVHGPALLGEGRALPSSGFLFEAHSESDSLDPAVYGTTWVAETFVRELLSRLAPARSARIYPRGLAGFQDLWVVAPPEHAPPAPTPPTLEHHLDRCSLSPSGTSLGLTGWVVDRQSGDGLEDLRVQLGERTAARVHTLAPRPDVAGLFPAEKVSPCGFDLVVELGTDIPLQAPLRLTVRDSAGEDRLFLDRPLCAALDRAARLEAFALLEKETDRLSRRYREEAAQLEAWSSSEIGLLTHRLRAMEASRFWRARQLWFAAKRLVRLRAP